jgi:hypothetical protein
MMLFCRILILAAAFVYVAFADDHESCEDWASMGECEKS